MAKYTQTPVPFWLSQSLTEFTAWIRINNDLIEEENERIKSRQRHR